MGVRVHRRGLRCLGLGRAAAAAGDGCAAAVVRPNIFSLTSAAIALMRAMMPPASSLCSKKLMVGLAPATSTILASRLMLLPRTVRLPKST